jgi:flavodoxin
MNVLVLYDSLYGNTEKVAEAIAKVFVSPHKIKLVKVTHATFADLNNIDLLIVGSPTQGGRATENLQLYLNNIPEDYLKNVFVTSFDTGFLLRDQNFALRLLLKTIGYAAPKIANILKEKGGQLIAPPEGFVIKGKKGPLAEGELGRAEIWANTLQKKASK